MSATKHTEAGKKRSSPTKKTTGKKTGRSAMSTEAAIPRRTARATGLTSQNRLPAGTRIAREDRSGLPRRANFIVGVLGNRQTAQLLRVSESQPSRWRRAQELPGPRVAPLIVDLDHVIGRLLLLWDQSVIADWLTSSNAFLTGARPIDVLVTRGSTEVVDAIDAEAAGAYA